MGKFFVQLSLGAGLGGLTIDARELAWACANHGQRDIPELAICGGESRERIGRRQGLLHVVLEFLNSQILEVLS